MSNLTEIAKENGALVEGPCQACGGSGVVMETITVPVCCGRCSPHGDCCGNPDPAQDYQPAPCQCGGLTFMHLTPAQLQATVEQVCKPLVDALEYSIRTTVMFRNDGKGGNGLLTLQEAVEQYRKSMGHDK